MLSGNAKSGQVNKNGNDGTVSRFGWKAQNKSLLIFSGEAYNVEMGVSNELFQTEREENSKCQYATTPNDTSHPELTGLNVLSDVQKFADFMRLLAPPKPSATVPGGSDSLVARKGCFRSGRMRAVPHPGADDRQVGDYRTERTAGQSFL